ncbi:MAG: hypothetical protein ABIO76_11970, partial [Ginsengibacter sp.]
MILLLTDTITPRLQYIAEFIFKGNFGVDFLITTDKNDLQSTNAIRIDYTDNMFQDDVIKIRNTGLLFETTIYKHNIETFEINGLTAFFKREQQPADFPFDIFSATFYLLTRYEEYLPHATDKYGRYDHHQSLATVNGFLKIPLVNKWLQFFSEFIKNRFPGFKINKPAFSFLPTFDVDIAFEWQHKSLLKNAAHLFKLLLRQDYENISEGFKILSKKKKDPFDNFDFLDRLNEQHELFPLYFFLVAERNTSFDKNINPFDKKMQALIKEYAKKYEAGIHPSWYSSQDDRLLKKEKFLLEEITGEVIKKSRQHYLHFNLPDTYRNLADAGIQDEYSMGYGTVNGFRASYAGVFNWYD